MKYSNIKQLNSAFVNKKIDGVNDEIHIDGAVYKFLESTKTTTKTILTNSNQPNVIVYGLMESENTSLDVEKWLALIYESENGILTPRKAINIDLNPFLNRKVDISESEVNIENRNVVGDTVEVRFTNLPTSTFIKGKIDTGATISCLHADSYQIDKAKNQVSFRCSHLSNNTMTLTLVDMQSVQSANGTDYRPVVEMDVRIGETALSKMKFNLNDRSEMDAPILIGQNILEAGKFLIDPSLNEDVYISWPDLNVFILENIEYEMVDSDADSDIELDDSEDIANDNDQELDDIYQILRGSDVKLSDLIEYANTYNAD